MDLLLEGRYRIGELIGTGGAASVYRAFDEFLGREVAIKVFDATTPDDEEYRRRHTETLLLATLNHPGLVTLFDAGLHQDSSGATSSYLVMELINGPDLRRRLQSGPLPAAEVAQISADVADALNYIHQNGVIHRDIKPANILLNDNAGGDTRHHPKLSDFGIARMVEATAATAQEATIGTAYYLSPEQALGGAITPATDVYSLALVLLECLTAEKAFPGAPVESAVARLHRDPEIPRSLGEEWVHLLTIMTARDPQLRPGAHDVAVALRSWSGPALAARAVSEDAGDTVPEGARAADAVGTETMPQPGVPPIAPATAVPAAAAPATAEGAREISSGAGGASVGLMMEKSAHAPGPRLPHGSDPHH